MNKVVIAVFLTLLTLDVAHSELSLRYFKSETGICSDDMLKSLDIHNTGKSLTLYETSLYRKSKSKFSLKEVALPSITTVRCHFADEITKKVLVSAVGENQYCGWVNQSDLLVPLGEKMALKDLVFESGGVCGKVKPLTMKQYCDGLMRFGEMTEACQDSNIRNTVFAAKFLANNIELSWPAVKNKRENIINVPVYLGPESDETISSLKTFTDLRVFKIEKKEKSLRILVGPTSRNILGWIDLDAGYIWHSKLTVFYSEKNDADVLADIPSSSKQSRPLAVRPVNLIEMLSSKQEFQKYPVLADRRKNVDDLKNWLPHLEVAFIGNICSREQSCTGQHFSARGYIETATSGSNEENWDYFVALSPSDLRRLRYSFEDLCMKIGDSDGSGYMQNTIISVIEILTGDKVGEGDFRDYFLQRDQIPLSNQTLLGEGLKGLIININNPSKVAKQHVEAYKKEVCRTATLLKVVTTHHKLKTPYDEDLVEGGDLRWDSSRGAYLYKNAVVHDWLYSDSFERKTVFLPLSYLPDNPGGH